MKPADATKHRGRPRQFDEERALEKAMQVFWRRGYEGASLPELTKAMGINRPSLYAAFGNKEALFRRVLDRYAEGAECVLREATGTGSARQFVERLLLGSLDHIGSGPGGCLMVQGALACGADSDRVKKELAGRRAATEAIVRNRLARAVDDGELRKGTDVGALAKFYMSVLHGMAVQGASGAKAAELREVARIAMDAWPA